MTSSYIGKVVDNYRILTELGIGGMGVVFKAIHTGLDKIVALKMIAPGMSMNANFIRRFQTEAKALARLQDPNIVQIFDLRSDSDQWFIVMEFVNGGNLSDIIRKDGAMTVDRSIRVIKQVLSAIGHAHKANIIHRDIKPNNVMLAENDMVKITDFGLAKDQGNVANTITVAGGGTLYYMSPEHVKGFSFTDHRSDIYSIGMTFYEMISGNVPFKNLDSDFDIREMIVRKEMVPPKAFNDDIPESLEAIIMKAIAKSPEDRYQSCEDMIADLERFEQGESDKQAVAKNPVQQESESTQTSDAKKSKIKYWLWAAVIPVLLLFYILFQNDSNGHSESAVNEPALSSLQIQTIPNQALVLLNNDTLDQVARSNRQLNAGQYRIRAELKGFSTRDTIINLNANENRTVVLDLNPIVLEKKVVAAAEPQKKVEPVSESVEKTEETLVTSLNINSEPADAEVWINGKSYGRTPVYQDQWQPGSYNLRITKEGFKDYVETISLRSGATKSLVADLVKESGAVEITSTPPGALVKIDGNVIGDGKTPFTTDNIEAGNHTVSISLDGFETIEEKININTGDTFSRAYTLNARMGNLIVMVRPWGSIYINNQLKKATTDFKYNIKLPAVSHLLKVSHPTLGFWEREVKIKPDADLTINVNFNKTISVSVVAYDTDGNPVQAEIMLDNKPTGELTPREINLRTGLHRLTVMKDGYIAVEGEKRVLVDESTIETQKFILQKIE